MPIANLRDPRLRVQHVRIRLRDAIQHLRADSGDVDDPQLRAIFETSAEVLSALVATLDHYEERSEPAWQDERRRKLG